MTSRIVAVCGSILAAGLAASAQAPQPPNPPSPPPASQTARPSDAGSTVTLTGCLKTSNSLAAGPFGSPGATPGSSTGAAADEFILTNIERSAPSIVPAPSGGTRPGVPATPDVGARPSDMAHDTYLLKAQTPSVNLAQYVNHMVQVTGTMVVSATSPAFGAQTPATPPGAPPTAAEDRMKKRALSVATITMVAAKCP